jgi:hypothetical protein
VQATTRTGGGEAGRTFDVLVECRRRNFPCFLMYPFIANSFLVNCLIRHHQLLLDTVEIPGVGEDVHMSLADAD